MQSNYRYTRTAFFASLLSLAPHLATLAGAAALPSGTNGVATTVITRVQLAPTKSLNFIEQPLPPNGSLRRETKGDAIAPFKILTSGDTHYMVKLEDANTGRTALTVFVRAGQTAEIKVPLGNYVVKYASGRKWYGYKDRFGEETAYNKAETTFNFRRNGNQISGFSITLYAVAGGNLSTAKINPNDF